MPHYGTLWTQFPHYRTHSTGNISSFFEDGTQRNSAEIGGTNPTELFFSISCSKVVSRVVKWYLV
jgi:hypothetical protein